MGLANQRFGSIVISGLIGLWLMQVAWLIWRFAPEAAELWPRWRQSSAATVSNPGDPTESWLTEVAHRMSPESTYILVDCYETGQYAKIRYLLHPRRQIRLDPKTTPAFLYQAIHQHGARYILVGGCNLNEPWPAVWQTEPSVFLVVLTAGPGLLLQVDPTQLTGGFYD